MGQNNLIYVPIVAKKNSILVIFPSGVECKLGSQVASLSRTLARKKAHTWQHKNLNARRVVGLASAQNEIHPQRRPQARREPYHREKEG